jgi:hypothetical protein
MPAADLTAFENRMIGQGNVGGLRIPLGRIFGIFPRYHKAALFLNFDREPNSEDRTTEYTGDITVHGHTMYVGTCCDGIIRVNWDTKRVQFESASASFTGAFNPRNGQIDGRISLRGIENLECQDLPICFRPIE